MSHSLFVGEYYYHHRLGSQVEGEQTGSVTLFFNQMRHGDSVAVGQIWSRFFPRLEALAKKTLAGRPQRVTNTDDAVQSAFASFCIRVRNGQFEIEDRDDLWKLLGTITANKARKQVRRERAEKRGSGNVTGEDTLIKPDGSPLPLAEVASELPAQEFDTQVEELLNQLEPELREFAVLRLMGYRNKEIAELHDCTERKIERKLNLIRLTWNRDD